MVKRCSKCATHKELAAFYPNPGGVLKLGSWCKECMKLFSRSPAGRFRHAVSNAKNRDMAWTLTEAEFASLLGRQCYYCDGAISSTGIGLDRLDNALGYISGNVVPCCKLCNFLKGDRLTPEETLAAVQAIKEVRARKRAAS